MLMLIITFMIFLVFILLMSVGFLFQKKTIIGSCGGLSKIGINRVCDCPSPCSEKKIKNWNKHRIEIKNL